MDYKKALEKASAICSKQEYCRSDILKKLDKWEVDQTDQEKILKRLTEEKFIDESRFATFYVKDKFRFNRWGRQKIRWQLRLKGLDDETIDHALEEIDDEVYRETLQKVLQDKLRQVNNKEPVKQKAALVRNALSKGYEYEEVIKKVEQLLNSSSLNT
ncbi:MAG: regulatory protein RecX [Marinilabiliaceae bacterium]